MTVAREDVADTLEDYDWVLVLRMGPVIDAGAAADSLSQMVATRSVAEVDVDQAERWLQRIEKVDLAELPEPDTIWVQLEALTDRDPLFERAAAHLRDSRQEIHAHLQAVATDLDAFRELIRTDRGMLFKLAQIRAHPDVLEALDASLLAVLRVMGESSIEAGRIRDALED